MSKTNRFVEESLPNSITSNNLEPLVLDLKHPFSFVRWIEYNKIIFTNISDLLSRYKNYVTNWYIEKNRMPVDEEIVVKDLYINLLNEIIINYTSTEERRFLKNIDPSNSRDLSIAVPFFAEKIKDICLYYSTLRDKLQNSVVEYNLKGSNFGLESLIYNEISKTLEAQDLVELIKSLNLSVSAVRNNILIELEENYDQYANYLDIGTLPITAYNPEKDLREKYFSLNTYEINPDLYIDFDSAVVSAIKQYPFYLIEIGTNNFTINYNVQSSDLNFLKDRDFTNLINNQDKNNLSLNSQAALTEKYMGVDYYYLSTGSTGTDFVSGLLFNADSPFANYLNKNTPTVAAIASDSNLVNAKKIGLFFKPDKIGLLSFANFSFTYSLSVVNLSSNSLYIFPDPEFYGKVSGGTKQDQTSPLTFTSDGEVLKVDYSNSYKYGEIVSDPLIPTYRAYQSREQSLNYSNQGLSRYIDPQDFFKEFKKDIWANSDVYPLIPSIEFPIDSRTKTLLALNNKTLMQYKSDVYGNDYGIYKIVGPPKDTIANINALLANRSRINCFIIDGYLFYDEAVGYDFNYTTDIPKPGFTYSGVILKTTNNMPPGSGYFTHATSITAVSPLSAIAYNNGVPSFILSSTFINLESYRLQPENFCTSYVRTDFICNIRDAFTFLAPNSGFLTDYSSDNPDFNPTTTQLYYDILADAGVNPIAPGYRPNFTYAGTFLMPIPVSAAQYDCSFFITSAFSTNNEPCVDPDLNETGLFLQNYYYDAISPEFQTAPDLTPYPQSERKTLYEIKFENYGDFYYRNSNSSIIEPVSSALSAVFTKYPINIVDEIHNKLINFDIYYDYLQLETENNLIFDRIEFNYKTNKVTSSTTTELYITRGSNKNFEKISTVWFNEKLNNLVFAKTNLSPLLSSTNFKIIYPTIYILDLNRANITQIYPTNDLTTQELQQFSLSGTNFNVEIVSIDKPIMTYSSESGNYSLTYLARDTSDLFYVFVVTFKYYNGVLSNIRNIMYKANMDYIHNNFNNPAEYFEYNTYTILGSSAGTVTSGGFVFGA